MAPLVSIIVPCYNYGHFLSETLDSLHRQSFGDWECLLIDDGSTDGTKTVGEYHAQCDSRIHYHYQDNRGLSVARNTGLRAARGKYIQFLDSDDMIECNKLQVQVDLLESCRDIDIVYGGTRYFSSNEPGKRLLLPPKWSCDVPAPVAGSGLQVVWGLLHENMIPVNAPLMRRSVLNTTAMFDKSLGPTADWDFWLRAAVSGCTFFHKDEEGSRALVRCHSGSMSTNALSMARDALRVRRRMALLLNRADCHVLARELASDSQARYGMELASAGKRTLAFLQLAEAAVRTRSTRKRVRRSLCCALMWLVSPDAFRHISTASWSSAVERWLKVR